MKIYIADSFKIKAYQLPTKVEDSYLIHYISNDGIEEDIIFVAENDKWTILSDYDISISNEVINLDKAIIDDNKFYHIRFNDLTAPIYLYCFKTPIAYYDFEIGNRTSITFGRNNADICYDQVGVANKDFCISLHNNKWIIEDSECDLDTYINGKRCTKAFLKPGDIIFSNGLKIIWMVNFIRINNPKQIVKTTLSQYKNFSMLGKENKYTPVRDIEKGLVLYDDSQTFFHTPRFKSELKEKTIKITNPPQKINNDEPPAFLTLGATIIMGISSCISGIVAISSVTGGNVNPLSIVSEVAICLSMLLGCILFPLLLNRYNKNKIKTSEAKRQQRYREYLDRKKQDIKNELENEKRILYDNYLSIEQLKQNIVNNNGIWSKEISDSDFLSLRVGIGNRESKVIVDAKTEDFSMEDDDLKEEVEKIINNPLILTEVPITVSLIEKKILPLIIEPSFQKRQQFIDALMLQFMAYYSAMDLKIVVLTNEGSQDNWNYLKYLPYCYSDDRKTRFFATNIEEMKPLSTYLEEIYNDRMSKVKNVKEDKKQTKDIQENVYKNYNEYYLIITDDFISVKKLGIIEKIINSTINLGFSLLTIDTSMKNMPNNSDRFIYINNSEATISGMDLRNDPVYHFTPEYFETDDIANYSSILANIPISFYNEGSNLPSSINFLEMFRASKIDQLNIVNRWSNHDPTITLSTPIGIDIDGKPFMLDLHEKYHGPHGLIAGSTGSGKSEFIITFILSMAINYHPYEVQFVLIDYKGGGLAGAFENRENGIKIPHLIGTITNLDTSEMNRTLVSIKSELKRRQTLLSQARDTLKESTIDIYKYQRFYREGIVKEPLSHLFIISDEFAELKSQQPEFIDELVSTARIGRSLGIHLILATQKPSGVVDDQIWSNSRFKVCLKVQTPEDSNELLKRPEAAYIKETGRFYLQVGYNESFELGQSAWSGAKYYPTERLLKNINDDIIFINSNGDIVKSINESVKVNCAIDYGDQITNIVKSLYDIAIREKIEFRQLWLPSIPKEIYLQSLVEKYHYHADPYEISPLIGEYDIPQYQEQKLLTINFTNTGHLVIYGNPGSGKENLLETIIYSICSFHSPEEAQFYILDFGAEVLKIFNHFPHVGDVVFADDKEKIANLFLMLEKEINRRKELFSDFGGSYLSFIKNSQTKLPLIITVLNNYEGFSETCDDYIDFYIHLLRDSAKYGIIFIMTVMQPSNISLRVSQCFTNKIAMQLTDSFDYKYTLNAPSGLVPAKNFGRGIVSIDDTAYEFQSAFIYYKDSINNIIKDTARKLTGIYQSKARSIPVIPRIVNSDTLMPYIETISNVPIGIDCYDASVYNFNFWQPKMIKITGTNVLAENGFLIQLIKVLNMSIDARIKIIDFATCLSGVFDNSIDYHNDNFTDAIKSIPDQDQNAKERTLYILVGISSIYDVVLAEGIELLRKILVNNQQLINSRFLLVDNISKFNKIKNESFYDLISPDTGIWVGKNINLQNSFKVNNISKTDANEDTVGVIYPIVDKEYRVVKGLNNIGSDY